MKFLPLLTVGLLALHAHAQDRPPLTDEQKLQLEERANAEWKQLSPEAKTQALRLHRAITQMPPEERRFIHDRIKRFMDMKPEERRRLKENADRWNQMSPEEREKAREQFRQRRKEFEEKWRQEHPGEEPPFPPRGHRPPPPPPDDSVDPEPKPQENP